MTLSTRTWASAALVTALFAPAMQAQLTCTNSLSSANWPSSYVGGSSNQSAVLFVNATYTTTSPRQLVPVLTASKPSFGANARPRVSGSSPNTAVGLFLGVEQQNLNLTAVGAPGCRFYVKPLLTVPLVTDSQGAAQINLAIPTNAGLLGQSIVLQAGVSEPTVNPLALTMSNGRELIIGN